ncbi:hypothetical protein BG58_16540 [Caballeronia jiangsuensis]|nr:hypothetical protein BG58_16540 [Caballeronia jiangsuensis]
MPIHHTPKSAAPARIPYAIIRFEKSWETAEPFACAELWLAILLILALDERTSAVRACCRRTAR